MYWFKKYKFYNYCFSGIKKMEVLMKGKCMYLSFVIILSFNKIIIRNINKYYLKLEN